MNDRTLPPEIAAGPDGYVNTDGLTPRETEILKLIAEGLSSKQIAIRLGIAFKTVVSHRSHIMNKFDVHDAVGLLRYAIREN